MWSKSAVALTMLWTLSCAAADAVVFPISGDSYDVNIFRKYTAATGAQAATWELGTCSYTNTGSPALALDGYEAGLAGEWALAGGSGDFGTQMIINLDSTYTVNKIGWSSRLSTRRPGSYMVEGWNGSQWVEMLPWTAVPGTGTTLAFSNTFEAKDVSKIRFSTTGRSWDNTGTAVSLHEIKAYAASTGTTLTSHDGLPVNAIIKVDKSVIVSSNTQWKTINNTMLFDNVITSSGLQGKSNADGAMESAVAVFDLKRAYDVFMLKPVFFQGEAWANGSKIRLSADGENWTQVFDSSALFATQYINLSSTPMAARYVELTNYYNAATGCGTGRFTELEVYSTAAQTTATAALTATPGSGALAFGSTFAAAPKQAPADLSVNLANSGDVDSTLTLTSAEITGANAALFELTGYTGSGMVIPGDPGQAFGVKFLGSETPGDYTATLTFVTDAATNGTATYTLSAHVKLGGDANDDGSVDFADYLALESSFGGTPGTDNADFDASGLVDFADYLVLEANFGTSLAVPEPMTLSLLALGGLALIRRR